MFFFLTFGHCISLSEQTSKESESFTFSSSPSSPRSSSSSSLSSSMHFSKSNTSSTSFDLTKSQVASAKSHFQTASSKAYASQATSNTKTELVTAVFHRSPLFVLVNLYGVASKDLPFSFIAYSDSSST